MMNTVVKSARHNQHLNLNPKKRKKETNLQSDHWVRRNFLWADKQRILNEGSAMTISAADRNILTESRPRNQSKIPVFSQREFFVLNIYLPKDVSNFRRPSKNTSKKVNANFSFKIYIAQRI